MTQFNTRKINVDITTKCTLQCPFCERQNPNFDHVKSISQDITIEDFKKIADFYDHVEFCGSIGDPVMHKDFIEMLKYCYVNNIKCSVNTAVSHRKPEFYIEAFMSNRNAHWRFGIDGHPSDSHKHRINQDGNFLFEMMIAGKFLGIEVDWQYIIFSYNIDQIEDCKVLADRYKIPIRFMKSSRFTEYSDLLPPEGFYLDVEKNKKREGKLIPQCLQKNRPMGHQSTGYILPCCWLYGDVEKDYPLLCNDETRLSNNESIENILNSEFYKKFYQILTEDQQKAYPMCWQRCSTKSKIHKEWLIPTVNVE